MDLRERDLERLYANDPTVLPQLLRLKIRNSFNPYIVPFDINRPPEPSSRYIGGMAPAYINYGFILISPPFVGKHFLKKIKRNMFSQEE